MSRLGSRASGLNNLSRTTLWYSRLRVVIANNFCHGFQCLAFPGNDQETQTREGEWGFAYQNLNRYLFQQIKAAPKEKDGLVGDGTRPTFAGIYKRITEIQSEIEDSRNSLLILELCSRCRLEGKSSIRNDQVCRRLEAIELNLEDVKKEIMLVSTPSADYDDKFVEQCTGCPKQGPTSESPDISIEKAFCIPSTQGSAQGYLTTKLGMIRNGMRMRDTRPMLGPKNPNTDSIFPPRAFTASMPPKPIHFHGRPHIVSDIAQLLSTSNTTQPRVAILGSVGIGKTAIAVQVMESESVVKAFKHQHRAWVSCTDATSVNIFLKILGRSLGLKSEGRPSLDDILDYLNSSDCPRLLVLDRFEIPWNRINHMEQGEIVKVMLSLTKLVHVAILITMRSNYPPLPINWQVHHLPPIDTEGCRKIYTDICPVAAQDESALDDLLKALGHAPYAIVEMATHARKAGCSPGPLLSIWNSTWQKTPACYEIHFAIDLSVDSERMKERPDAQSLLATLSLLPAGTPRGHLSWWAPTLSAKQLIYTFNTLGSVGLLATSGPRDASDLTHPVSISPLVRSYMEHSHHISAKERIAHQETAFRIVRDRELSVSDPKFRQNLQDLTSEAANLHHILTSAARDRLETNFSPAEAWDTAHDKSLLDSLLVFSRYQRYTGAFPDVAQLAMKLSEHLNSDPTAKE